MSTVEPAKPARVLTPCVGLCRLNPAGYCLGCRRSRDEIATWRNLDDGTRRRIMAELPTRRGITP